jgi:hypothetical protein
MGLRFRKSIKIIPGVRLNVGLKRASLSLGGRGFSYNIGSKGSRVTVGLPGSGLSYSTNVSQDPIGLLANPSGRRHSVTPFVFAAFFLGLLYLALHSTNNNSSPSTDVDKATAGSSDTTSSIPQVVQENISPLDDPIPLPRTRPRLRTESVGPPLQLVPQQ